MRPQVEGTSRRRLLQLGGAAAAATVAAGVLAAERDGTVQAASARTDTATFQQSANGVGNVAIEGDGTSGAYGVVGTTDSGDGVFGTASGTGNAIFGGSASGFGVYGATSHGTGAISGVYGVNYSDSPGSAGVIGNGKNGSNTLGAGDGVQGSSGSGTGVYGQSTSGNGVVGQSTTAAGVVGSTDIYYGVWGQASGVTAGTGVFGTSNGPLGVGGEFFGGRANLFLDRHGTPGAPASLAHSAGDIYVDSTATLWYCVVGGTPGSWVRLTGVASGASGGALTFLSAPIRLLDTRLGASGAADTPNAPIQPGASNTFHLPVAGVSYAGVTIPTKAQALVGNCTVVNPAGVGDLAVYPDLLPLPNTAVMHYLSGQIVSNGITIGLGTNGKLAITALGSATDVIIDCQGIIM